MLNRRARCRLVGVVFSLAGSPLAGLVAQSTPARPSRFEITVDPEDTSRWIEVRGCVAEIDREHAEAHADKLTARYNPAKKHFYGDIYPVSRREEETRVILKIEPTRVALDAIFR